MKIVHSLLKLAVSLVLAVFTCSSPMAAAPVAVVNAGEKFPLHGHIDYIPDGPQVSHGKLLAGQYDNDFRRYDDYAVNFRDEPVWLRLRITNNTDSDTLVLSTNDVLYTEAEILYLPTEPESETVPVNRKAGLLNGHVGKTWRYHDIAFPVQLLPGQTQVVYLRLQTPYFLLLDPYVADLTTYSVYQAEFASWGHLMVGLMIGVLVYLGMVALYMRHIRNIRYGVAFVFTALLVVLLARGYIFNLLPNIPWLNTHLYPLVFSAQALAYIAFSRNHFKTQKDFPHVDKLLRACEAVCATLFVASLFIPLQWAVMAIGVVAFLVVITLCISSVYIWANSQQRLSVYVTGSLVFLFVSLLAMAEITGFIYMDSLGARAYEAGLCFQSILFALALAENISLAENERIKLVISAAEAQAENRAKGSFLAKMSHELRTPMNGLLGMLQLLERTPLNDQQQYYMQAMRNSGRLLLGVIDDVLDYSRIVAGKLRIEHSNFDLIEVLADIEALFTPQARQKQLALHFSVNSVNPLPIRTDALRLRQIIINLVGNAIKFTEKGTITTRIWIEKVSATRWVLHGEVEDTGIGIAPTQVERLFREYSRADGARNFGGSGLGLVICRQLVEMMGGDISVESAPGYGSVFRFHFDVLPPDSSALDPVSSTPDIYNSGDHRQVRILVAEDNDINREVILGLLEEFGYRAECVRDGEEAVRRACDPDTHWHLILMDIEMPLLDGLTAAQRIRAWEADQYRNATPIIALTAHAMRSYAEKIRQAGMDDHLTKPIEMRQLQNMLDKWLLTTTSQ